MKANLRLLAVLMAMCAPGITMRLANAESQQDVVVAVSLLVGFVTLGFVGVKLRWADERAHGPWRE